MRDQETITAAPPTRPSLAHRLFDNLDWVSAASFAVAGGLGLITIANTIRNKFYHAVILGYHESPTIFSEIVNKYTHREKGFFAQSTLDGLTGKEYLTRNRQLAKDFREEIATKLREEFNIETDGPKGWTVGTWQRWKEIGTTARIETTAAFTSVTAVTLGAISLLRHNQHILNHVEAQLQERDQRIQNR